MLSYFCSKCGGKNLYQFQKPKFCSYCGANFSLASTPSISSNIKSNQFEVNINTSNKKTIQENSVNIPHEDFEDQIHDYSSMRGLDVNIEKYNKNDGIKLGELVSDEPAQKQSNSSKKTEPKKRGRKKIAKTLPESFVSEAKMSGRNYQDYDGLDVSDPE